MSSSALPFSQSRPLKGAIDIDSMLPASMQRAYTDCWQAFLTAPAAQLSNAATTSQASHWKPPPRTLRFATATLALCLAAGIASFMVLALIVGLVQLVA